MSKQVLLDNVEHGDLGILAGFGPALGFDSNVTKAMPSELAQLQAEYPLFLLRNRESGTFEAVALLGFRQGENLYLDGSNWRARYLPLSIERQPFIIGFQQGEEDGVPVDKPVVCVDVEHPKVSFGGGEKVFLPQGGESPLLQRSAAILNVIHEQQDAVRALSQALVGLDLIEPVTLEIQRRDGDKDKVSGLHSISEERLAALEGPALESLHRRGQLQQIYMLLASLPNVNALIERTG